jgi:hypothetical protein
VVPRSARHRSGGRSACPVIRLCAAFAVPLDNTMSALVTPVFQPPHQYLRLAGWLVVGMAVAMAAPLGLGRRWPLPVLGLVLSETVVDALLRERRWPLWLAADVLVCHLAANRPRRTSLTAAGVTLVVGAATMVPNLFAQISDDIGNVPLIAFPHRRRAQYGRHRHPSVLQRSGVSDDLVDHDVMGEGEFTDARGVQAGDGQHVTGRSHERPGLGQHGHQRGRVRGSHRDVRTVTLDTALRAAKLRNGLVRDQPALTDDDEPLGGVLHLAHQMAGHEHRAPLGRQSLEQAARPAHALRVQAVERSRCRWSGC